MSEVVLKNPAEKWWVADCDECNEKTLAPYAEGPCPYCGETTGVKFALDAEPRAVAAQENVVTALWKLGESGPVYDETGCVRREFLSGVGLALETIMAEFGFIVTPDI